MIKKRQDLRCCHFEREQGYFPPDDAHDDHDDDGDGVYMYEVEDDTKNHHHHHLPAWDPVRSRLPIGFSQERD